MKCPNCKHGKIYGFGCPDFKPIKIVCDICKGTGKLPEDIIYDPERGEEQKNCRVKQKITLRDAAKKLKMSALELSKRERGYFFYKNLCNP